MYQSVVTPYAKEYANSRGLILLHLLGAIGLRPVPDYSTIEEYHPISSYRYADGDWTYFMGRGVKVFEMIKLNPEATNTVPRVLILHKEKDEDWKLSVVRGGSAMYYPKKLQSLNLNDFLKGGSWSNGDMVYTYLGIEQNTVKIVITNVLSGSGGFPEEGFKFTLSPSGETFFCSKVEPIRKSGHSTIKP